MNDNDIIARNLLIDLYKNASAFISDNAVDYMTRIQNEIVTDLDADIQSALDILSFLTTIFNDHPTNWEMRMNDLLIDDDFLAACATADFSAMLFEIERYSALIDSYLEF